MLPTVDGPTVAPDEKRGASRLGANSASSLCCAGTMDAVCTAVRLTFERRLAA
jgi:hypothetical protein